MNNLVAPKSFWEYTLVFAFFSAVGWIYEVALAFIYGYGFINRGFLFGPFLPIYGIGGVILILSLKKLMGQKIYIRKILITPIFVFVGIVIITTAIELVAGLTIDFLGMTRLWDYTHYNHNFLGLIALNTSLRFGIGGMIMLYILLPLFLKLMTLLSYKSKKTLAIIFMFYFCVDLILTLFAGKK